MTFFPLWTPARTMAMTPALREGRKGPLLLGEQVLGGLVDDLHGCWVVELWLDGRNLPGSAVLGTADLLLDEDGLLGCSRLGSGLLGELVDGLLVVHLAAAVLVNAGLQRSVPRATDLGCRHVEIVFFSDVYPKK